MSRESGLPAYPCDMSHLAMMFISKLQYGIRRRGQLASNMLLFGTISGLHHCDKDDRKKLRPAARAHYCN